MIQKIVPPLEDLFTNQNYQSSRWDYLSQTKSVDAIFVYCFSHLLEYVFLNVLQKIKNENLENSIGEDIIIKIIDKMLVPAIHQRVASVCVYEMHVAKNSGKLTGDTQEKRFQSFIKELTQSENLLALIKKYKVLSNVLSKLVSKCIHSLNILITHLSRDRELLRKEFNIDLDQVRINDIDARGDSHENGLRVYILEFINKLSNDQQKLVYKPRSADVALAFNEMLGWLNQRTSLSLNTIRVISKDDCSWYEYINAKACQSIIEVEQYYHRIGMLLAIIYVLGGYDLHHENLIAAGSHPIIVDHECLLRPTWIKPGEAIPQPLVINSLLLPYRLKVKENYQGIDLSGISGSGNQESFYSKIRWKHPFTDNMVAVREQSISLSQENIPTYQNKKVNPLDYVQKVIDGFVEAYQIFLQSRDYLLSAQSIINYFKQVRVRIVFRNTADYAKMIMESWNARLFYFEAEYTAHFDYLKQSETVPTNIIPDEITQLKNEDIPYFYCVGDGNDVFTTNHKKIDLRVITSAYENISSLIRNTLSQSDLSLQKHLIMLAFEGLRINSGIENPLFSAPKIKNDVKAIADNLLGLIIHKGQNILWPTLAVSHGVWNPILSKADLYGGYAGIGLAFAAAYQVLEDPKYLDIVKQCERQLHEVLVDPDFLKTTNMGGYNGVGGYLFALMYFHQVTHHESTRAIIQTVLQFLPTKIAEDKELSLLDGVAGLLWILCQLQRTFAISDLSDLIRQCATHILISYPNPAAYDHSYKKDFTNPLIGISHGTSGMALALAAANEILQEPKIKEWVTAAHQYETKHYHKEYGWPRFNIASIQNSSITYETSWCHGAIGIGISRLLLPRSWHNTDTQNDIENAKQFMLQQTTWSNHSLCHGALGAIDFMLLLYQKGLVNKEDYLDFTSRIYSEIEYKGFTTNQNIKGNNIVGIMMGSAGLLYQLARTIKPTLISSLFCMQLS